jgi:hypothetical protein
MTFLRWETLRWLLLLGLMRAILGYSDTASNICLFQSEKLSPGEPHNLTVPCRKPQDAEFQLSQGDPVHVTIPASNCTNTSENSELSLVINSSTPEGTLNLTVICQKLGPLCYSFTVERPGPNPRYTSDPYSISEICDSNNGAKDGTSATNGSSPMQGSTPGNTATAGNQSKPTGAGVNSQEPNSPRIGTAPQGQQSQTSSGVDTSGQGSRPSIAQTSVQGQPTQGSGVGSLTQSTQQVQAGTQIANPMVSTANSPIQPPQGSGTGIQSQIPQGTGQTKAGNAQTSCTCPG